MASALSFPCCVNNVSVCTVSLHLWIDIRHGCSSGGIFGIASAIPYFLGLAMRLIRLSLIGLYLFLGLALFCLSMSSARSAVSDSQSTSLDILPAKVTSPTKFFYALPLSNSKTIVCSTSNLSSCCAFGGGVMSGSICTASGASGGIIYWHDETGPDLCAKIPNGIYNASACNKVYSCPPIGYPDYTLPTSKPNEANSDGKYCKKPEPENPCTKLKGLNDSLQVTKYFVDKTGGSPACKDGCEMTRVAGNAWEYWTDENKVTWAVASYVYSGNECSDDYNYREVQSAQTPSSGQSTVPSSAASSAEPTAPSSATSSAGGTGSNPSSGSGTNTNPSGGSGTGNDPNCYGTNQGSVCNGASGSTGSGGGAGAGDGSGTPPASSATPASGGEGTFTAPNGSKDYLKDVFSSDAVKSVQAQREATLTKINEKMAQIKALTNINSISVSGDISPDVKSVRGNDIDFSGKDIISKFSISWVFYFVTALLCMDIILNRRKK